MRRRFHKPTAANCLCCWFRSTRGWTKTTRPASPWDCGEQLHLEQFHAAWGDDGAPPYDPPCSPDKTTVPMARRSSSFRARMSMDSTSPAEGEVIVPAYGSQMSWKLSS